MAGQLYRCTNFAGGCDKALTHEQIEIEAGEEAVCPNPDCGLKLEPVRKGSASPPKALVLGAIGFAILIVIGVFFSSFNHHAPDPATANRMLSDFYPQLPPARQ